MDDLRQPVQLRAHDGFPPRQRVRLVQRDQIVVLAQKLEAQAPGAGLLVKIVAVFRTEADDADLGLAAGERFERDARVTLADDRVDRLRLRQAREILRGQIQHGGRAGDAHAQPVRHGPLGPQRLDGLGLAQDGLGVLQEDRAARRRPEAAGRALKDAEAQHLLHVVQDAAEVRLADKQVLRGLRDRPGAFDLNNIL